MINKLNHPVDQDRSRGTDDGPVVARQVLPAVVLATLLGGCGPKDEADYPSTNLGGIVTVDGTPIADGTITFSSLDSRNGRIVVAPVVRGRYMAQKVPLGKVLAVISASRETGRTTLVDGQSSPEIINLVPPKYRAGIELDVVRARPEVDFKMTSN